MSAETKKAPPVEEIREGNVRIPIWGQTGPNGVFYIAGEPEVSYQKDGQWHKGSTYDSFELEALALAALNARKAIRKLNKAAKVAHEPATGNDAE
jgi:hypothetical protein